MYALFREMLLLANKKKMNVESVHLRIFALILLSFFSFLFNCFFSLPLFSFCATEQLLEFMHQLPAFANMTMSVRRELCSVMVFEVVEQAGTVILHNKQEV